MFAEMPWTTIATSRIQQRLAARQVSDRNERVRLACRRGRVAADECVDEDGGDRGACQADPDVPAGRGVATEVGDARHERQCRARHQRDRAREADPGQVLVRRVEHTTDLELRIAGRHVQRDDHADEDERDRQHDAQQPAHHVEAEHGERRVERGDGERDRDQRRLPAAHRLHDGLDRVAGRDRLGSEPVGRGDHAVGRAEEAGAPETEARARGHLAGEPVVDADLGDRDHHRVRERLPEYHRQHRPPERQAEAGDRDRAEHVHHRVQEEREVDREEVPPAGRPQLGRDRLDPVLLDRRHVR